MNLPVCSVQYPSCGACGCETEHDGDSFICSDCALNYGDGEDGTEAWFMDEEAEVCGIQCKNNWHKVGTPLLCESCKLPVGHKSDCWTDCGWG